MKNLLICFVLGLGLCLGGFVRAQSGAIVEAHLLAGFSYPDYGPLNDHLAGVGLPSPLDASVLEQQYFLRTRKADKRLGWQFGVQFWTTLDESRVEVTPTGLAFQAHRFSGLGTSFGLFYELLNSERLRFRPILGIAERRSKLDVRQGDDLQNLLSPATSVEVKTFTNAAFYLDASMEAAVVILKDSTVRGVVGIRGGRLQSFSSQPWMFDDSVEVVGMGESSLGGWYWGISVNFEFGIEVKKGKQPRKS